jgi:hypothetical protein
VEGLNQVLHLAVKRFEFSNTNDLCGLFLIHNCRLSQQKTRAGSERMFAPVSQSRAEPFKEESERSCAGVGVAAGFFAEIFRTAMLS